MSKSAAQTGHVVGARAKLPDRYLPEHVVNDFGWFFLWATLHMLVAAAVVGYIIARWFA